jgi:hypothetical protein
MGCKAGIANSRRGRHFWSNMLENRSEFISRLLYSLKDNEPYSNPGKPPAPGTIAAASAAAIDVLGFDAHKEAFTTLAEVIDVCTAEELESKGSGQAARNAAKHPQVLALTKLRPEQRAAIAAAAFQGLAWMEDCRQWVQDATLRNQIAKRVMTGIVVAVGRTKKGYSCSQLGALVRIGSSSRDNDMFVLRSRGAIAEILAASLESLPRDDQTIAGMRNFLDKIAAYPNAAPVFQSIEKLLTFTSEEHAVRLRQEASQWR